MDLLGFLVDSTNGFSYAVPLTVGGDVSVRFTDRPGIPGPAASGYPDHVSARCTTPGKRGSPSKVRNPKR